MNARALQRSGRLAWALLGILGAAVLVGYVASLLTLVVVPLILALFPATLLVPLRDHMRRWRLPDAPAALATLFLGLLAFAGVVGVMVSFVVAEIPRIAESVAEGMGALQDLLNRVAPQAQLQGIGDLVSMVQEEAGAAGDAAVQAMDITMRAFETLAGLVLTLVILFFYLKDGRRLADSLVQVAPPAQRSRAMETAEGAWDTLGRYFRGQLLVALGDAVGIGVPLFLLGIPLAVPLAVLVFFGGLFPIVGAIVTGSVAILVALADGGWVMGLIVAGIVVAVQQLEGNVLEPLILSRAINLSPLVVILVITAGGLLLGVLGAFLAVPTAAIIKRAVTDLRSSAPAGEPHPAMASDR